METWQKCQASIDSNGFGSSEIIYGDVLNHPDVSIDLNFLIANTEWYDCFCEDGNYGLKVVVFSVNAAKI